MDPALVAPSAPASVLNDYADLVDLLISANRELAVQVRLTGIVPLTATEVAIMRYVNDHDGCSPSDVAMSLSLLRSNVSPALKSMEGSGLLERRSSGRDVRLNATPKAAENLRLIRERWGAVLSSALDEVPHDLMDTIRTLRTIDSALVRQRLEQTSETGARR